MTTDKNEQDYNLSFSFCGIVPYLQKFFSLGAFLFRKDYDLFMYSFIYYVAAVSQ